MTKTEGNTTPALAEPPQSANPASRAVRGPLLHGDVKGVANAFLKPYAKEDADLEAQLEALKRALFDSANFAVELRRENVAVIGTHDAFVRHTPAGSLRQVIAPVRLSLHDNTLYQIPRRKQVGGNWTEVIVEPHKANVSYSGLLKLNGVAGCSVGQPPTINVDGTDHTNPYIQRAKTKSGRPGDITRILVGINVVGPIPMTGNMAVVQYTLDYDPAKDLQHMLTQKMGWAPNDIFLIDEEQWESMTAEMNPQERYRWKLLPLYAGVGIAHNLRCKEVTDQYQTFVGIMQNALKKAQTVARRNAMKAHPALAIHTVQVDKNGVATVRGIGWAGTESDMERYAAILDRMAHGLLPDLEETVDLEVIDIQADYDPEQHHVGDKEQDAVDAEVDETDDDEVPGDEAEAARLISLIDDGLEILTPAQAAKLDYRPHEQTVAELGSVFVLLNALIDGGE